MNEEEIRPAAIFDEYLRLAEIDSEVYFGNARRDRILCPACSQVGEPSFVKSGFAYELCGRCRTLFVSPRPEATAFGRYYTEAPSSKYWATTFYKLTAEARREKLWKPKARIVADLLARYAVAGEKSTVIDVGGGYGLFAEEFRTLTNRDPLVIEPSPHLAAACRKRGLRVVEKFLEDVIPGDLPGGSKSLVSFELFEHLHDPLRFLQAIVRLMSPGDLFVFTTLSGAGVDIQTLWEHSKSVSPPHHLNFFNPASIRHLLVRGGLELVEVTTPGKLDIDIMANNRDRVKDRFWQTFLAIATKEEMRTMQDVLAASGWSSHMMVVCRRPA